MDNTTTFPRSCYLASLRIKPTSLHLHPIITLFGLFTTTACQSPSRLIVFLVKGEALVEGITVRVTVVSGSRTSVLDLSNTNETAICNCFEVILKFSLAPCKDVDLKSTSDTRQTLDAAYQALEVGYQLQLYSCLITLIKLDFYLPSTACWKFM